MPQRIKFAHFLAASESYYHPEFVQKTKVINLKRKRQANVVEPPYRTTPKRDLDRQAWSLSGNCSVEENGKICIISEPEQPVTSFLVDLGVTRDGELAFDPVHLVFYQ